MNKKRYSTDFLFLKQSKKQRVKETKKTWLWRHLVVRQYLTDKQIKLATEKTNNFTKPFQPVSKFPDGAFPTKNGIENLVTRFFKAYFIPFILKLKLMKNVHYGIDKIQLIRKQRSKYKNVDPKCSTEYNVQKSLIGNYFNCIYQRS